MLKHPLYLVYGALLLGSAVMTDLRGWGLTRVDEMRGVPKSIRDNPGAYRAIYANYYRYSGGK